MRCSHIHHAFSRANGLRCPTDLLRGIFAYVFCFRSFREVAAWAVSTGLSANGDRSWAKRTHQSSDWLLSIVQTLVGSSEPEEALELPEGFTGCIRLVDATHLRTWKRSGESRRLHCSYELLSKRLDQVLLTDHHVGEGLWCVCTACVVMICKAIKRCSQPCWSAGSSWSSR